MDSAYSKLRRAQHHLEALRESITAYRASEPITFRARSRTDPIDSSLCIVEYIVEVAAEPPTELWGLITGDILTNLRAALDHAVFAHATAHHTLSERVQRKLQFPVVLDRTKWAAARTDPQCGKWVTAPVLDVISQAQPFNDVEPQHHALNVLNKLVNHDKHRGLRIVAYKGAATFDKAGSPIESLPASAQPLTNGAVLARTRIPRPLGSSGGGRPGLSVATFEGEAGYIEVLDIPITDVENLQALSVLDLLVRGTQNVLDALQAAGC